MIIFGICFGVVAAIFAIFMFAKNDNTYRNQRKVLNAIHAYHQETELRGIKVFYDDMEDYDRTLWRLWDWGCTRILDQNKFEIIKPYLEV